jgi:site-specific DNA-cytosine methylase
MYFEKSRRQLVFNQCIQVGETADIKGYDIIKRVYSVEGKAPSLTTMQGGHREPKIAVDKLTWRKLTPLECERLQTVPDGYTSKGSFVDNRWAEPNQPITEKNISNSQRYKMLGNGWTIAVIAHILGGLT